MVVFQVVVHRFAPQPFLFGPSLSPAANVAGNIKQILCSNGKLARDCPL